MRRRLGGLLLGVVAGAIATVSHALAGGHVDGARAALLMGGAGLVCAVLVGLRLPAARGLVPAISLVAVQVLAHPWLESGHGGHGTASHASPGLAGMVEHALTPSMLMFGAHLVAIAATLAIAHLAESLVHVWTRGLPLPRRSSAAVALSPESDRPSLRGIVRGGLIRARAPPLAV